MWWDSYRCRFPSPRKESGGKTGSSNHTIEAICQTRMIDVSYDPTAGCPEWLKFLRPVTADNSELISFLQRAIGFSLTGSIREQCLFVLYVTGSNGKSAFLRIASSILGDY